jgi:hypothetical protein
MEISVHSCNRIQSATENQKGLTNISLLYVTDAWEYALIKKTVMAESAVDFHFVLKKTWLR